MVVLFTRRTRMGCDTPDPYGLRYHWGRGRAVVTVEKAIVTGVGVQVNMFFSSTVKLWLHATF